MKINIGKNVWLFVALLIGVALVLSSTAMVPAQSMGSAITFADGNTAYTTTTYSTAYLVDEADLLRLHGTGEVSGTGNITITPQFSMQPVACRSATSWFDAEEYHVYNAQTVAATTNQTVTVNSTGGSTTTVTSTLTADTSTSLATSTLSEGSINPTLVISGGTTEGRQVQAAGVCVRLKMEGSSTYTPTVWGRLTYGQ